MGSDKPEIGRSVPSNRSGGGGGEAGGYRESAEAKKGNYWLAVTESQVFVLCVLTL